MAVAWIELQPIVEIDACGVKTTYQSGDEVFVRRVSHAFFRKYLETNLRKLDEYMRSERDRDNVVGLESGRH